MSGSTPDNQPPCVGDKYMHVKPWAWVLMITLNVAMALGAQHLAHKIDSLRRQLDACEAVRARELPGKETP